MLCGRQRLVLRRCVELAAVTLDACRLERCFRLWHTYGSHRCASLPQPSQPPTLPALSLSNGTTISQAY
jgi:hypothetical protein